MSSQRTAAAAGRPVRARRRDRHGRGLRGPLVPPGVPLARSRSEQFDDLVLDAVEHLEVRWETELAHVEFAVEEVPRIGAAPSAGEDLTGVGEELTGDDGVPLARLLPGSGETPSRIVVYRRPIEARAPDRGELADLVHDVIVEQVARLLGLDPDAIDPPYEGG
ncbi:MAG: metallopeptidase family protein [Mycobacteriales bacterium]